MRRSLILAALILPAAFAASACGDSDPGDPTVTPTAAARAVTLQFDARVGEQPFACGQTYADVGSTASTFTPWDLRLYVSGVTLWTAGGEAVALELDQDGAWQSGDVALLDFEDATGGCTGTAETRSVVTGTVPAGDYTGLSFTVGVPFEINHDDATLASPPLDLTAMFWSWAAGYKFIRLDGASTGMTGGFFFHLGSTGCQLDEDDAVTSCAAPNRPEISLPSFDPDASTVVMDVGALFEGVDLDSNAADTAPLCMSQPMDPDCAAEFAHLGLGFGGSAGDPAAQSVFSAQ